MKIKLKKKNIPMLINFGMLFIAVLSALTTFNSFKLNRDVAENQDELNEEYKEYLQSQKEINEGNLKYLEDLMSPDIYFVAIPKASIDYTVGNVYGVKYSDFVKNREIEFRVNNRGKKPLNLINIVAYSACTKYDEHSYLSMADL